MENMTDEGFSIENNIVKTPNCEFIPDSRGLGSEICGAMNHFRDEIAQYIPDRSEAQTYGSLLLRCVRTAIKLRSFNLSRDDVICICSDNHKNTCVPYIAALLSGIKVACLVPELSAKDCAYLLNISKPKLIFASNEAIELINHAAEGIQFDFKIVSFDRLEGYMSFDEFLVEDPRENHFEAYVPGDLSETAIVVFSSGTTGMPKGVCISHYTMMRKTFDLMPYMGLTCRSGFSNFRQEKSGNSAVILSYSNFYWISASLMLTCSIFSGSSLIIRSKFEVEDLWNSIHKYKVTFAFMAPSYVAETCRSEKPEGVDVSSLKHVLIGGSPLPSTLLKNFRNKFPDAFVSVGYGCTEIGGPAIHFDCRRPKDAQLVMLKEQSCGRPINGIWYKVVDMETKKPLGPNRKGELKLKSSAMCSGYINSSDSPFDDEGWLLTGDLVYYDEAYCFYVIDRLKQMLKYKNWQIPPAVIEEVVVQHPAVKAAVVVGLPHPEYGDLITAVVIPDEKHEKITAEDIQKFVDDRVDDHKKLRGGVKFVTDFPLTPSKKVRRFELKQMLLSGKS